MKRKLRSGVPMHCVDAYAAFGHAVMNRYQKTTHIRRRLPRHFSYRMVKTVADRLEAQLLAGGAKVTWVHINGQGYAGTWAY